MPVRLRRHAREQRERLLDQRRLRVTRRQRMDHLDALQVLARIRKPAKPGHRTFPMEWMWES